MSITQGESAMPKYLIQANYVGEGLKGLLREGGSGRRAAVEKLFGGPVSVSPVIQPNPNRRNQGQ
jgi:hypothetical protein